MYDYKPLYTHSALLGHSFWLDDNGTFMSAPTFKNNQPDLENQIAVSDWQNLDELTSDHFSHIFGYIFKLCVLNRDYVKVDYYANLFGTKEEAQ